ncbi:PRC-barrel domain-containing protein [Oceaniglobus indicus]|uniref:PRC-barrel domain-containing protein n=1 Tax=Oceaniglobus indicus TaxID=2047749 RepID=UPI000C179D2F|nr:PRC-barrel domain-containing protein [Oceaniglobus indicus]
MTLAKTLSAAAIAAALAVPAVSVAQTATVTTLQGYVELDEMDVIGATGDKIGEVESVLIGPDGKVGAVVIETEGFLGLGDEDIVMMLDDIQIVNGEIRVDMTEEQLEQLPKWDD